METINQKIDEDSTTQRQALQTYFSTTQIYKYCLRDYFNQALSSAQGNRWIGHSLCLSTLESRRVMEL